MPFKIKNSLKSFPMEKLCFDLKLEVLEQMEPRDVLELVKVNEGFKGMLVRDPSVVLGERVFALDLFGTIWIRKFFNSPIMELNASSHASFVKRIRSCDSLECRIEEEKLKDQYTLLHNLKSVNILCLEENSREALKRFFSNVHASIRKQAILNINLGEDKDDQMINDFMENFIMRQLKDCEKFRFDSNSKDLFRFYDAFLKTEIKSVYIVDHSANYIDWMAQQIFTNGIPSKNPEAAILISTCDAFHMMDSSQYPGIRQIDGENRLRLLKQAVDVMEDFGWNVYDHCPGVYYDHYEGPDGSYDYDGSEVFKGYFFGGFEMETSVFCRRIDSTKDCVCVYGYFTGDLVFLAFYVPVG